VRRRARPRRIAAVLRARVGVLRAMNRGGERVYRTDRKETHWRTLKRNQ
jgi:hypothetical protein